jgi:hypothetical protein
MATRDAEHSSAAICPPRWAEALLHVLLPPDQAETVSGDLIEEYRETVIPHAADGAEISGSCGKSLALRGVAI